MATQHQRQTATTYIMCMMRQFDDNGTMHYNTRTVAGHLRIYRSGVWVATIL